MTQTGIVTKPEVHIQMKQLLRLEVQFGITRSSIFINKFPYNARSHKRNCHCIKIIDFAIDPHQTLSAKFAITKPKKVLKVILVTSLSYSIYFSEILDHLQPIYNYIVQQILFQIYHRNLV